MWYDEVGKIIVYRHTRVVFDVTCSPFLLGAVIDFHLKKLISNDEHRSSMVNAKINIPKLRESFYVDNCVTSLHTMIEVE